MKKIAKIPSFLLSSELTASLKLQDQSYIMIIPKPILRNQGISDENISFDLVVNDGKIALIGPPISDPRVTQPGFEEIAT